MAPKEARSFPRGFFVCCLAPAASWVGLIGYLPAGSDRLLLYPPMQSLRRLV
jgi:hypothetical protein